MKTAIIDADSFIYIVAWRHKETIDPKLVLKELDDLMVQVIENTEATHYLGVFSPKKTFRNALTDTYKANRPPTPEWVTKWKQTIIDYCISEYGFVVAEDHEADDVLSIMQGDDVVLCHIDKDINQVPGDHYNYKHAWSDDEQVKKGAFYNVSKTAAEYNFWYQVLAGDSTDGIKGARKIGPVNAAKILATVPVKTADRYTFFNDMRLSLEQIATETYEQVVKETFKTQNGEFWQEDYEITVSLIRLLRPTPELVEKYRLLIQQVKFEDDKDLVGDLLNYDRSTEVSANNQRPYEGDVLPPAVDLS
jgi:DNA polymerase I